MTCKNKQRQKQIPYGNDKQKTKQRRTTEILASLRMTSENKQERQNAGILRSAQNDNSEMIEAKPLTSASACSLPAGEEALHEFGVELAGAEVGVVEDALVEGD